MEETEEEKTTRAMKNKQDCYDKIKNLTEKEYSIYESICEHSILPYGKEHEIYEHSYSGKYYKYSEYYKSKVDSVWKFFKATPHKSVYMVENLNLEL